MGADHQYSTKSRFRPQVGVCYLVPRPLSNRIYSLDNIAEAVDMGSSKGSLIGADAGPFHRVGRNRELSPNISRKQGYENVDNKTCFAQISPNTGDVSIEKSPSLECVLIMDRKVNPGRLSRSQLARRDTMLCPTFRRTMSYPFKDSRQLNDWQTYYEFDGPIFCMTVPHSSDPGKAMCLRMEHTHGYSPLGDKCGGHYHYDVDGDEDIEYEGYFNTAKAICRIDMSAVIPKRDLHD